MLRRYFLPLFSLRLCGRAQVAALSAHARVCDWAAVLAFKAGASDSSCSPAASRCRLICIHFSSFLLGWDKISAFQFSSVCWRPESANRKPRPAQALFTTRLQSSSTRPSVLVLILLLFLVLAVVSLPLLSPREHAAPSSRTLVLHSIHGTNVKLFFFTPCFYAPPLRSF